MMVVVKITVDQATVWSRQRCCSRCQTLFSNNILNDKFYGFDFGILSFTTSLTTSFSVYTAGLLLS